MRFAVHKAGDTAIFQILEAPDYLVDELVPAGAVAVPVALEVTDTTHIIVDGVAVLKSAAE